MYWYTFSQIAFVAPRAGAWIETPIAAMIARRVSVAPRAGAWIETVSVATGKREDGRAPRGRVD